jgi:hypothetical protein
LKDSNLTVIFPHVSRPDQVVSAVELGFDIFNGAYPMKATQQNQALMFDYVYSSSQKSEDDDEEDYEVSAKRRKVTEDENKTDSKSSKSPLLIDLGDKKYKL